MDSRSMAELPDGKILVGFTQFNFPARSNEVYLARLNPDGSAISLEPPFPGVFTNSGRGISVLSALSDGSVLVGGIFSLGTNAGFSTLTRLNSDGTWDATFDHAEINGRLTCLALQPDGKILVGGQFSAVQGAVRTNIARLHPNGSLDSTFTPAEIGRLSRFIESVVNGIAVQSNKVIIAGLFGSVGGLPRWNIARLNAEGSHDDSFYPRSMFGNDGLVPNVQSITLDESGRILIYGQFDYLNNDPRIHLARLHADGSLDASFFAPIDGASIVVQRAVVEPGGKIVIAGGFSTTGAVVRADIARLNSDGSVDPSFNAGDVQGAANRLIRLEDGKYLVGGQPTAFNGVPRFFAARLMGDTNAGPGKIQFIAQSFEASEDNRAPAQLVAARSDGRVGAISVEFSTVAGTATRADFISTNGHVLFGDGDFTPKTIDIEVVDDSWKEASEEFMVVLKNPQGGAATGQPASATVRIKENDFAGSVDTSFAPDAAVRGVPGYRSVEALLCQPDGRLVIGGQFTEMTGTNKNYLTRLNDNGSVDLTFDTGTGPDAEVRALTAQPDGRILVGGNFTNFNSRKAKGLVRLQPNGGVDQSFSAGEGADGPILSVAVEAGGSILVGGEFETFAGAPRVGLARLNSAGVLQPLDVQLSGEWYAYVQTIAVATNGTVYVGGLFERAGGLPRNGLFRLRPDHSIDPAFSAPTGTNQFDDEWDYTFYVYAIVPLRTGKVVVGGDFYTVDGETRHGIVLLNDDGSLDRTFVPDFDDDSYIAGIAPVSNGQFYVAGSFDLPGLPYWVDGVARLHSTGRVDWTFVPALVNGFVNTILLEPNRQLILGGYFDECAGTPRDNIARLNVETIPALSIEKGTDGKVRVSWPEALGNVGLEGGGALGEGAWTEASPAALSNGRYNSTNSTTELRRFFRARN